MIGHILAALPLLIASASWAQGTGDFAQNSTTGVRSTTEGAFVLLEHGVWPASDRRGLDVTEAMVLDRGRSGPMTSRTTYLPMIYAAEVRHGIPAGLLDALIWAESRYNPIALSPAGAAGLSQLMPATARELGVANRYDPIANIDGGARYLRRMLERFGSVHLAVAAYNAGPNAVAKVGRIPFNGETPIYVARVMRRWMDRSSASD
jgi:hypothetical protein